MLKYCHIVAVVAMAGFVTLTVVEDFDALAVIVLLRLHWNQ
jgi:hypothetical protein